MLARRSREVPDQHADQFALAVPEAGEQLAFFFGRQQVGGEGRRGRCRSTLADCPDRLRLAVFMAAFLGERFVGGFDVRYRDCNRVLQAWAEPGLECPGTQSVRLGTTRFSFQPTRTVRVAEGEKKSPTQLRVTIVRRLQRRNAMRSKGSGMGQPVKATEPVRAAYGRWFCGSSDGPSSETTQSSRRSALRFALTRGVPRGGLIVGVQNRRIKQQGRKIRYFPEPLYVAGLLAQLSRLVESIQPHLDPETPSVFGFTQPV